MIAASNRAMSSADRASLHTGNFVADIEETGVHRGTRSVFGVEARRNGTMAKRSLLRTRVSAVTATGRILAHGVGVYSS